ncbi:MAG: hypothetical protein AAF513_04080 [Pseudomonadota bacterium]
MSDIYLELAAPGLPSRLAPPMWRWQWHDDTQTLCLVSDGVAQGTSDFSADRGSCVDYIPKETLTSLLNR